jgi:hypothetical protein
MQLCDPGNNYAPLTLPTRRASLVEMRAAENKGFFGFFSLS